MMRQIEIYKPINFILSPISELPPPHQPPIYLFIFQSLGCI